MKLNRLMVLPLLAGGLALVSGCVVRPYGYGGVAVEPAVVVAPPPPVYVAPPPEVTVDVVPDSYCWDGFEYVGVVGGGYYYLGPGHVWLVCDSVRFGHWHDYVGVHPDWHAHVTVNVNFRNDAHGHYHAPGHPHDADPHGPPHDNNNYHGDDRAPQHDNRAPQHDNKAPQHDNKAPQRDKSAPREDKERHDNNNYHG